MFEPRRYLGWGFRIHVLTREVATAVFAVAEAACLLILTNTDPARAAGTPCLRMRTGQSEFELCETPDALLTWLTRIWDAGGRERPSHATAPVREWRVDLRSSERPNNATS